MGGTVRRDAVTVVGSVSIDAIEGGPRPGRRLGGTVVYSGLTYRRHGLATRLVCNLAPGDRGGLAALAAAGATLDVGQSRLTTGFHSRLAGDGRCLRLMARARPISGEQLEAAVTGARLIHLGPLHPGDLAPEVADVAAASTAVVLLDLQGLVRSAGEGPVAPELAARSARFLAASDIVKADAAELETMLAGLGLDHAGLLDRYRIAELVETRASAGGRILLASGGEVIYAAEEVPSSFDATGAGDVFIAAYCWARLWQSESAANAARHAATVAARQVAGELIRPPEV